MVSVGTFPFGTPIVPVQQSDRTEKLIFILGVYASAVHAQWIGPNNKTIIRAVGVASEPEIFWRGERADKIIQSIPIPAKAGKLKSAGNKYNGPSGRALDKLFLEPLGISRSNVWLCDIVPHSCMNIKQRNALNNKYVSKLEEFELPSFYWPTVPREISNAQRRKEIELELHESKARVLITLGDQPLKWFAKYYGSKARLLTYGDNYKSYGRLHPINIGGYPLEILPLVHPRQAGRLGKHSSDWATLHDIWLNKVAPFLF